MHLRTLNMKVPNNMFTSNYINRKQCRNQFLNEIEIKILTSRYQANYVNHPFAQHHQTTGQAAIETCCLEVIVDQNLPSSLMVHYRKDCSNIH